MHSSDRKLKELQVYIMLFYIKRYSLFQTSGDNFLNYTGQRKFPFLKKLCRPPLILIFIN